ncbi:di-trans,poly-cis-decaprenylcistransferase [Candidatus Dependentiae bacterium]|nr:di-trans,poly-cis-decaprenylcistransferase [Candidatus Dependentiae bacterium]
MEHLALIMDGNRRWAKKRALAPWLGHNQGIESVRIALEFCLKNSINYLSLYVFSLENFKRAPDEVQFLFDLFIKQAEQMLPELIKNGIQITFIGDKTYFPEHLLPTIQTLEAQTQHLTTLKLALLFCYGGRQEIVTAAQQLAYAVKSKKIEPQDITQELFARHLWSHALPDPDLIIRTGGVKRLSNFLLYQAAYSELYFLDILWPDITYKHFEDALSDYQQRSRNFGS